MSDLPDMTDRYSERVEHAAKAAANPLAVQAMSHEVAAPKSR